MLEDEEYASDSDQSDDDYKPGANDSDPASEVESDENDGDDSETDNHEAKPQKRKRKSLSLATRNSENAKRKSVKLEAQKSAAVKADDAENSESEKDDEVSKEKADALWADFLGSTSDSQTVSGPKSPKRAAKNSSPTSSNGSSEAKVKEAKVAEEPRKEEPTQKRTLTEIFEFAGERVEVQKEVDAGTTSQDNGSDNKAPIRNRAQASGGLSSVLGQINKKNKLSVLEKSKLDWTTFKRTEGIDEELQTHNKGRDGFLERQDFLERTDLRQFEIEKNMRATTRRKLN